MSQTKRYGDPRKSEAQTTPSEQGRSKGELSVGFIFAAWAVFFVVWLWLGSLLVAAIVFGLMLTGAIAILHAR
jgi:hypothetical protein